MDINIGGVDRWARIVAGLALVVVGVATLGGVLSFGTMVGAIATLLGGVLVVTGLVRVCPLYRLLGVDTLGHS